MGHLSTLTLSDTLLFDVFCALAVHKIYNKYEVNPANFLVTFPLLVGVPGLPCYFLMAHLESSFLALLISFSLFYATLTLSVVLYRISPFHPLARYPGPLHLKISKFATMYHELHGKQYLFFKDLHDKYGPYVRVGPNELSVADIEAIQPILGIDGTRKGPQAELHVKPGTIPHVVSVRDVNLHHERRKLWNRAFTSASMKELQPAVENRVLQLIEELGKRVSQKSGIDQKPLDLSQWISYFTYDFMGDMVFGGGFELMRDGDKDGIRATLEGQLKIVGILQHIPWITRLVYKLATIPEEIKKFQEFAAMRYDVRKQQGSAKRDLFHYITNEDGLEDMEVSREQEVNEVLAAIAAGADTTSSALGGIFFYLLSNPASLKRLQDEVDSIFPLGEGEPFDAAKLAGMPYLNAVINEGLRLQPPIHTSLQRSPLEGSGGKWVAGRFVTESTAMYVPPYVLHRDERYFSPSPNSFIPERWIYGSDGSKFKCNTAAFIPFSTGPANCVGKNLALLEMRLVVASMVQRFEMRFAEGYDPSEWERNLRDYFLTLVGRLPVVLIARE